MQRPHNPMPESRYEVLALFTIAMVGASLLIMSTGPLLPFLENAFHLRQTQMGLVLSVQLLGPLATTWIAGMLTDRYGDKLVVLWTGWIMGLSLIAASAVPEFGWLLFWLFVYGIGFAAVTPAGSHAIVFFFKKEERGFAMGIRQCGMPIAGVLGSVALPAIALHFDYRWAFVAAGLATLVTATVASMLYREPVELEGRSESVRAMIGEILRMLQDAHLIFITLTSMVLVSAQVAVMGFLSLALVHEAHYSVTTAAGAFTIAVTAAIAGRLTWGWASDKIFGGSRALPLAVVCVGTGVSALLLAAIVPTMPGWAIVAISALMGFCSIGWFGLVVCALAEIGGDEHAGSALGAGLTWCFLASVLAPLIFGALVEARGYTFAWQSLAVLSFCGIVPAMLASRLARRHAKAVAA